MEAYVGGAFREITTANAFVSGAWRALKYAEAYIDGQWRTVANFSTGGGTITLTISPSPTSKLGTTSVIGTNGTTATPAGGLGPYTYLWVKQSGDAITCNAPTSASTTFTASGMLTDETRTALYRCTATDSLGSTAYADVTVTIHRRESFTGGTA